MRHCSRPSFYRGFHPRRAGAARLPVMGASGVLARGGAASSMAVPRGAHINAWIRPGVALRRPALLRIWRKYPAWLSLDSVLFSSSSARMAPATVAALLLASVLVAAAPAAARAGEPYVFPPTPPSPYPMEREAFLSAPALRALLATNTTWNDSTGVLTPDEVPLATPFTCGARAPGTDHMVRCDASPPLGGIVLEPPCAATASIIFLHGRTEGPWIYQTLLHTLLRSAPTAFASVRWVFPLAPRYTSTVSPSHPPNFHLWFDLTPVFDEAIGRGVADAATTVAGFEEALVDVDATNDALGLFFTTRRVEAIVAAERRALPAGGKVVLFGHSAGAAAASHVAAVSRVHLDGVVAAQGYLPGAPALLRLSRVLSRTRRRYRVELVAGGADQIGRPALVDASARLLRRVLRGSTDVHYTLLPGATHFSMLTPGRDADAVVDVLRRYLE